MILRPNSRFGVHLESRRSSMSRSLSMARYIWMDGSKEFRGMMMKPLLRMSLRSRLPLSPYLQECGSWKGQGDWEEDWGETYPGKREPAIFVIDVNSGEVHPVEGTRKLSVGQVVWAPASGSLQCYLVFVGWPSDTRKLGIKYCYNRPCALYAVRAPFSKSEDHQSGPDGKALVFLSAKSSVDSWIHSATQSLHRIDWSPDVKPSPDADIVDVVPVVMCPEDGCFPGRYL